MRSLFAKTARAALVAIALGGAALGAMPAQAAYFGFGYGGPGPYFPHPHPYPPGFFPGRPHFYPRPVPAPICLSDFQVRQRLQAQGYFQVYLNAAMGSHIQARATRGSWIYLIDYNRCAGYIVSARPLRHR